MVVVGAREDRGRDGRLGRGREKWVDLGDFSEGGGVNRINWKGMKGG